MRSSAEVGQRLTRVSDEELLRSIRDDLRSLYAEVIRQPLPLTVETALARIDREQSRAESLRRPRPSWT
jgi:hypothetical protein